jgi:hypothetical protein
MKKYVLEFLRRGLVACGFGPVILAIIYLILQQQKLIDTLTVNQVCLGIFSLTALAFIAGGMNTIYQIEKLPLMIAIFIHGSVLYLSYLATYLLNGWLGLGIAPIIVFSSIFVFGYVIIWVIIYFIIKRNTNQMNELLKQQQQKG